MQTVILQAIRINGVRDVEGSATVRLSNSNAVKLAKGLTNEDLSRLLQSRVAELGITATHEDKSQ